MYTREQSRTSTSTVNKSIFNEVTWARPQAASVRLLMVVHNVLAMWRVVETYENNTYWFLALGNVLLIVEGAIIIVRRGGVEYSWKVWSPCFLVYLAITIPNVWLLQLNQNLVYVKMVQSNSSEANLTTTTAAGGISVVSTQISNQTEEFSFTKFIDFDNDVWMIVVQESLIYIIVMGRWILPRGKTSRQFLADLILEFLAMASDIMELFAVFDDEHVLADRDLTLTVLTVWTASFIQFIPILTHKRRYRHTRVVHSRAINRVCGDKFLDVIVTLMSVFLQDGPFLVVRLYIMIAKKFVTYSLVFFVLKNIISLMLLIYRLTTLCHALPCCHFSKEENIEITSVDDDKEGHRRRPPNITVPLY